MTTPMPDISPERACDLISAHSHKITVMRDNDTLDCTAFCECGWISLPDNDRAAVWGAATLHVREMNGVGK